MLLLASILEWAPNQIWGKSEEASLKNYAQENLKGEEVSQVDMAEG